MAPIRFSRRRTPDGVERGLRRTGRRKREENQNTTPEDAFGRKRECIHRRPPLVVSETGRGKQRFRQVGIKPATRSQSNSAAPLTCREWKQATIFGGAGCAEAHTELMEQ
jgi:hypothetical protein